MARPRKEQIEEIMTEENIETKETVKKTKGTPPNWKPSGQLPNLKAPSGFTAKWCNPAKLSERRSEGWQIMKPSDNKGAEIINIDVNDVGSLTGALRYRELVAIMLPKELKEARDNWLKNENLEATKTILKKTDKELAQHGVETYAPNGQSGRIVIE
jgi:hypothetical protein